MRTAPNPRPKLRKQVTIANHWNPLLSLVTIIQQVGRYVSNVDHQKLEIHPFHLEPKNRKNLERFTTGSNAWLGEAE